jgi:uncharacterized protein YndB with AHSA1/START domain
MRPEPGTTSFRLASRWRLAAPPAAVWRLLREVSAWPGWWRPNLLKVERLSDGDDLGLGQRDRFLWRGALPYRLAIDMETIAVEPRRRIVGRASGDLTGTGTWMLTPRAEGSELCYRWEVELAKPWLRRIARPFRALLAWNHHAVMRNGAQGMARALGCSAVVYERLDGQR